MKLGFKCSDIQSIFLSAPDRGFKFGYLGGGGRVGGSGGASGCSWACGKGGSSCIIKGFVVLSHALLALAIVAFNVNLFAELVHHPQAMAEARRGRATTVTSGIALKRRWG